MGWQRVVPWLVVASVVVPGGVSVPRVLTWVWGVEGRYVGVVCARLVVRGPVGTVPVVPVVAPVLWLVGDVCVVLEAGVEVCEVPGVL